MAWFGARQHGAIARWQLLKAGFTRTEIQRLLRDGVLIPVHPGVYLIGHTGGSPHAFTAAAILASKPDSLTSHRTAARLWELPVPAGGPIEITTVGRNGRKLRGVRIHTVTSLPPTERRKRHGLPLTSPSLTILDLAGRLDGDTLASALNEARVQRLVSDPDLHATLAAHPNRRGARALRSLLASERGPRITRSEAERRALRLMRAHGLEPESNVRIGPWRVDFLFRVEAVVVEVDGYRYHSTPKRFVDDRRRAADLAARGLVVFALTWNDLGPEGTAAMARLRRTLDRRRAS